MFFFKKKFKTIVYIDGMSCAHCAAKVENVLNAIDGCAAKVDLANKCAYVKSKAPLIESEVFNSIETLGFTPIKMDF